SGEFGGLGVELTVQDGVLTVISPIEDTPAWKAGIQAGDKIVEIDGESTKGYSLVEAAQKMKGKMGQKIFLSIFRKGLDEPKVFEIVRGVVKIKSAKYTDLGDGFAYIRLTSFIENSYDLIKKEMDSHIRKYSKARGLILDLRRNPGGLLDQAVKISDLFLSEGTIVSTKGRDEKQKEVLFAKKAGTYPNFPIIVLIDEYSASASEIVSGALQDNKRALVMGRKSFGKGSVQSVVKLGDGSGLKLTVGRYYTPSGRSIQSVGITPDVELQEVDPETFKKAIIKKEIRKEEHLKGHLLGETEKKAKNKPMEFWWAKSESKETKAMSPKEKLLDQDFDLQQAYSYLKAIKALSRTNAL
ncbi:S41 family peptidase, partial [bacterium]|nr:S41 family peptidase [bacterium]